MEKLLSPDFGLMFWTAITFLAMVFILKRIAWGPLLKTLDEREEKIKREFDSAQGHKEEMERLKISYEGQLSELKNRARLILSEAEQKGAQTRESILKEAESQAHKLMEKGVQQLQVEEERLIQKLRGEVKELSMMMTEKLVRQTIDKKVQEKFAQDFLENLETNSKEVNRVSS